MKRHWWICSLLSVLICLGGCAPADSQTAEENGAAQTQSAAVQSEAAQQEQQTQAQQQEEQEQQPVGQTQAQPSDEQQPAGTISPQTVELHIGDTVFSVVLEQNEAVQSLLQQLPLQLEMRELNGNEKYATLPQALPVQAAVPDQIQTGDLMLYGSDCLVLFYETFATSYSYTRLGRVTDASALAETVGSGSVTVTIALP